MKRFCLSIFICLSFIALNAQTVDTVAIFSNAMQRDVKNVVILPQGYDKTRNYPVVYLLHGYGGSEKNWLRIRPDLPDIASFHQIILVCPDGRNSWYLDSPLDSLSRYETYISSELPRYVDNNYSTVAAPEGRAITGLSMGGHGALYNAIRHQDVFGACGSTSGGVDIIPFPDNWEIKNLIGDQRENPEAWQQNSVIGQLAKIKPGLAIIFDCGNEDFFHNVNENLHQQMDYRRIKHEYTVRPGAHNSDYWNRSIPHHLQFFADYFKVHAPHPEQQQ